MLESRSDEDERPAKPSKNSNNERSSTQLSHIIKAHENNSLDNTYMRSAKEFMQKV